MQAKIFWDLQIQGNKNVVANQPCIVVNKQDRKAVEVDVSVPSDNNVKKKEPERMWEERDQCYR